MRIEGVALLVWRPERRAAPDAAAAAVAATFDAIVDKEDGGVEELKKECSTVAALCTMSSS